MSPLMAARWRRRDVLLSPKPHMAPYLWGGVGRGPALGFSGRVPDQSTLVITGCLPAHQLVTRQKFEVGKPRDLPISSIPTVLVRRAGRLEVLDVWESAESPAAPWLNPPAKNPR